MNTFCIVLSFLGLSLVLWVGLISVIRNLAELHCQGEPLCQESAPICNDEPAGHRETRSQFAWQSRSHFRAPD
jgi:hypothetical protein